MKIISKIKHKSRQWIIEKTKHKRFYPLLYKSYWHTKRKSTGYNNHENIYFTAEPNIGAGIGHQMANWIAGYWFAKLFNLQYAHSAFPDIKWEEFLGFGEDEIKTEELIEKYAYKKIRLPFFDEDKDEEIKRTEKIINSYSGKKILFVTEQDQFYRNQFGVMNDIKKKFYHAEARKCDKLIYNPDCLNIAMHVRRAVIIGSKKIVEDETIRALRWLSNDYYEKVLKQVLEHINVTRPIKIYIFSTSKPYEFLEFSKFGDVNFCSEMDEYASFLHLVRADLLITSKSSFSYKPALLNNGIKICPRNFWHSYPERKDWILVENDGTFDLKKLEIVV